MPHFDAAVVVAKAVLVLPVELGDFDLETTPDRDVFEVLGVPHHHFLHLVHDVLRAEIGTCPRWAVYPQGIEATHRCGKWIHVRQVGVVINVEVRNEHVIDLSWQDSHAEDVLDASVAKIEKEPSGGHQAADRMGYSESPSSTST